jgi:hypothetical protein
MSLIERGDEPRKEEACAKNPRRRNGDVWYEERGRYLFRYGPNGTIFNNWTWTGEPLPRRGS